MVMKKNTFIWADLSAYEPEKIKPFYEKVFGWKYYGNDYSIAYKNDKEIVGLYQTPLKFQEMKMPSFWMSYIQVNDVKETVAKARNIGAIIELVEESIFGNVALIRDTSGAGFTVYDGDKLNGKTDSETNTLIFNELHVSNASIAKEFYENLFNWSFKAVDGFSFDVYENSTNKKVASVYQIDNSIKGKYEYWTCVFGVENLQETISKIKENNGIVISEEENRVLCSDGSEAFFYIQKV